MVKEWKKERVDKVFIREEEEIKDNEMHFRIKKQNEIKNQKQRDEINRKVAEFREHKEIKKMREEEERENLERHEIIRRRVKITKEDKERLKSKEMNHFMKQLDKINNIEIQKFDKISRMEHIKLKNKEKYSSVSTKFMEETANTVSKNRSKFDNTRDVGKFAQNMGGSMVRTTGRALCNWKSTI